MHVFSAPPCVMPYFAPESFKTFTLIAAECALLKLKYFTGKRRESLIWGAPGRLGLCGSDVDEFIRFYYAHFGPVRSLRWLWRDNSFPSNILDRKDPLAALFCILYFWISKHFSCVITRWQLWQGETVACLLMIYMMNECSWLMWIVANSFLYAGCSIGW